MGGNFCQILELGGTTIKGWRVRCVRNCISPLPYSSFKYHFNQACQFLRFLLRSAQCLLQSHAHVISVHFTRFSKKLFSVLSLSLKHRCQAIMLDMPLL